MIPFQQEEAKIGQAFHLLPDDKKPIIYALIMSLIPDDIATDEDLIDIAQAKAEYQAGDYYNMADVNWN